MQPEHISLVTPAPSNIQLLYRPEVFDLWGQAPVQPGTIGDHILESIDYYYHIITMI